VGQYDFPVLLGCAILIYAIRRERLVLTALGAALLTFKPHLGIPIFLGLLLYLLPVRDRFSRRALAWIFSGLAILCVIGLLADPTWMVDYPRSFQAYQTGADIASCAACDSLPSWLATHSISSPSLFQMTLIGAGLFLVLILLFSSVRAGLLRNVGRLLSVSILIPLLAIPHLYNYDFVLLLVPFAVLAEGSHGWGDRIALMLLYVFPFLAIAIFGRVLGDPSLLLVALALALLVFLQARPRPALDVSRHAA
jgi:hypothetical protein